MEETKNEVLEEKEMNNLKKEADSNEKSTFKTRFVLPLFLVFILVCLVGYIGYDKHQENASEVKEAIFQEGTIYGAEIVLQNIFREATSCTPLPMNNGSLEINIIAVECLSSSGLSPSEQ